MSICLVACFFGFQEATAKSGGFHFSMLHDFSPFLNNLEQTYFTEYQFIKSITLQIKKH